MLDYIEQHNPSGARNVKQRVLASIELLKRFPRMGTPTSRTDVRMLVANPYPYLIYYEIDDAAGTVFILDVRHGARRRANNP